MLIRKKSTHVQRGLKVEYSGTSELLENEESLKNYSAHIIKLVSNAIPFNSQPKSLDFGAGTGFMMQIFEQKTGIRAKGIEIDPKLISIVKSKGFECYSSMDQIQEKFDLIFTSNVLEHIENDENSLSEIRNLLSQDGVLVIYVPALPFLFSQLDTKVGHYRRYTRKEIKSKLIATGYHVETARYVDSLGVLAALLTKIIGYKNQAGLGSRNSLIIYDRILFPISKVLDFVLMRKLIGKNLFVIAHPIF